MPRVTQCRGLITSEDPRELPLRQCKEPRVPGLSYCEHHKSQASRQDALRSVVRGGWQQKLVAARGRPREDVGSLPSVEEVEAARALRASVEVDEPDEDTPIPAAPRRTQIDMTDPEQRRKFLRGDL